MGVGNSGLSAMGYGYCAICCPHSSAVLIRGAVLRRVSMRLRLQLVVDEADSRKRQLQEQVNRPQMNASRK